MAIYTGLITKLKATDDEIAQVMGHEIGHALANHGAEKMSTAMLAQGAVVVAAVASGERNQNAVMAGGTVMAQLGWLLPNSRGAETEADRIGIEIAARAGFDPAAAVSLWQKMTAANGKGGLQFLSTHPTPTTRIKELSALVPHMQPLYAQAPRHPVGPPSRMADNVRDATSAGAAVPAPKALTLIPIPDQDSAKKDAR
jgi:predicted Zn-dependent protease